jgi:hypothetical protein
METKERLRENLFKCSVYFCGHLTTKRGCVCTKVECLGEKLTCVREKLEIILCKPLLFLAKNKKNHPENHPDLDFCAEVKAELPLNHSHGGNLILADQRRTFWFPLKI